MGIEDDLGHLGRFVWQRYGLNLRFKALKNGGFHITLISPSKMVSVWQQFLISAITGRDLKHTHTQNIGTQL